MATGLELEGGRGWAPGAPRRAGEGLGLAARPVALLPVLLADTAVGCEASFPRRWVMSSSGLPAN